MYLYSIDELSTKTNTKKSLFLNILRYNHLLTKTIFLYHYIKQKITYFNSFSNYTFF